MLPFSGLRQDSGSVTRTTAGFDTVVWGQPGDKPVPADYDGDGKSDAATFRPVNANWYIRVVRQDNRSKRSVNPAICRPKPPSFTKKGS